MNRPDICDNCKRKITNGDHVTVIIPNVEISTKTSEPDTMHLKLSKFSLTTRAMKVYCNKCLEIKNYIPGEDHA
jgi:hypothetical protein